MVTLQSLLRQQNNRGRLEVGHERRNPFVDVASVLLWSECRADFSMQSTHIYIIHTSPTSVNVKRMNHPTKNCIQPGNWHVFSVGAIPHAPNDTPLIRRITYSGCAMMPVVCAGCSVHWVIGQVMALSCTVCTPVTIFSQRFLRFNWSLVMIEQFNDASWFQSNHWFLATLAEEAYDSGKLAPNAVFPTIYNVSTALIDCCCYGYSCQSKWPPWSWNKILLPFKMGFSLIKWKRPQIFHWEI